MAILTELQEQETSSYEKETTSCEQETLSYEYDVFLSFRGKDTRLSFTDHLYRALINDNIRTFLDEQEVDTGEELKPELTRAIKSSCASIIVLSKDYASSTWCLDELVMILEQKKTTNHIVLPIFYHVEPTQVRKQEGSFEEAMAKHKQMLDAEKDHERKSQRARKLELWTSALSQVANLKGKDAHGRQETVFIDEIVKEVNDRLGLHLRSKIPHLIGMYSSIDFANAWIKDKSSKYVDILTIWGMAGIGKTSLAEYVYKLHYREFKRSSFVKGIGRKCAQQGALLDLQKQLLGDVLKKSMIEVCDDNVSTKIENALFSNQTLLVLDDIDKFEQLDALIGTKRFHSGTKIIITTNDGSVAEKCTLLFRKTFPTKHTKHNLSGLSDTESLELLCWHAFGTNAPKQGYEQEAAKVATYCGGHPLALKVLGGSLINEDVATWSHIFERFETKKSYADIQKVLEISFNLLPSGDCQELFKHIACFFVGEDREVTETILKECMECGIRSSSGITKLIDRCLLTTGEDNELQMHQLVQEMGRDLVRKESPKKPWKRSRLWNHEDCLTLLKEDKGTSKVCGLALDMKLSGSIPKFQDVIDDKFRALSLIHWIYQFFCMIFARFFLLFSSPHCKTIELTTNALAKLDNLNLLKLNHVKLKGSYKNFPQGLKWLCMHGFGLKYIPLELPMKNLVALDMSYSDLEQLWKKPILLTSLKILNLSYCVKLVEVGGFSGLPSLEILILEGCASLNHVCESIGHECAALVLLDMSYCNMLRKLPRSIGKLKKVKILSISGCFGVDAIPIEMKDTESLKVLKAEKIPKLVLHSLPLSLVILSLTNNNLSNESFPLNFSSMSMLKELYLDDNPIDSLPTSVRSLSKLEVLSVKGCSKLKSVLRPPCTMKFLSVDDCSSLMKITFHEEMLRLPCVDHRGTESLNEIPDLFKFQDLAQVDEEVLSCLGWTNLLCVKDQELNSNVPCTWFHEKKLSAQMLYEYGIFSTYFFGKEVPDWLGGHKCKGSSLISFMMPSTPVNKRFQGFNIVCVHAFLRKKRCSYISTTLVNKTKNLTWEYLGPQSFTGEADTDTVWLSHWMFVNNEFEDGDEATIQILGHKLDGSVMVKECAISPMYGDISDMDPLAYYKSWKFIIGRNHSPYPSLDVFRWRNRIGRLGSPF